MEKYKKPAIFIIFLVIFYLVVNTILNKYDKTAKWGNISIPDVAFPGKNIDFLVQYKDIIPPSQLFINISYKDKNNNYCGQTNYKDSIQKVYGTGIKKMSLPFNPPDTAVIAMIRISRHEIPRDPKTSIYKTKRIGYTLNSEQIHISRDGSVPEKLSLSEIDILKKGYSEGFWKENRGDPTILGWLITIFYFVIFSMSVYFIFKIKLTFSKDKYVWFWCFVTAIVFMLGINKQLDIQMLLTDFAREYVKVQGTYVNRKPFQIQIVSILATIGTGAIVYLIYFLRFAPKRMWLAVVGMGILFGFNIVRLVSLHKIESFLSKSLLSIKIVDVLEIFALGIIAIFIFLNYLYYKGKPI